ncbi:MAG: CoA pyrophosphatase [Alphaproteobacteria bacterium]
MSEALLRRLARGLAPREAADVARGARGDVMFGPGERELAREQLAKRGFVGGAADGLKHAAVLIPIVLRPGGPTILLTERTPHLADHAGQISFPGGRLEPEDADAVAAALRETEEEIGLARRHVEVLGHFEDYGTVTGYRVTPIVGLARPPFDLTPDPHEVAEIFELPLEFILQPTNIRRLRETRGGVPRDVYEIAYGKWRVWGFTARILVRLIAALEEEPAR